MEQLLTRRAVASLLKISVGSVDNLRRADKLPSIKVGRRSVRFSVRAVQDLLGSRADADAIDSPQDQALISTIVQPAILRVMRRTRGFSQGEVAEKLGIPIRRLRGLETGRTKPRRGELEKIEALLSSHGERPL